MLRLDDNSCEQKNNTLLLTQKHTLEEFLRDKTSTVPRSRGKADKN
jgi:hypothetical protein